MGRVVPVIVTCFTLVILATDPIQAVSERQSSSAVEPAETHRATLNQYCVTCHNERLKTAGLALDSLNLTNVGEHAEVWEKAIRKLRAGLMPPPGRPRPERGVSDSLASWLESQLDRAAAAKPDPGRTEAFHRLNRAEYKNVIRDLLALDIDASLLPSDDASYGFDNIAGVLKINESRMEQYLAVARKISRAAVGGSAPSAVPVHTTRLPDDLRQYEHVEGLPFGTRGGTLIHYNFPRDGEYVFKVELMCGISGQCDGAVGFADEHQLEILLDDDRLELFTLQPKETEVRRDGEIIRQAFETRAPVKAGPRKVGATFLKLPSIEEVESRRQRLLKPLFQTGDNLIEAQHAIYQPFISAVSITGPFKDTQPGDTPSRSRIFICRPTDRANEATCVKNILSTLTRRAYRRPVTDADLRRLQIFYDAGRADGGFEAGIEMVLRRILASPEFLFRLERDPDNLGPNSVYRLGDLELASRLSFFLWSSMPDDELLDLASRGRLKDSKVLEGQVRRMLADPRSQELVNNFTGQWLQLRNLDSVVPSAYLFPDYDRSLSRAFRRETELFFNSILSEDRSVLELLTANYTFLNERLARHYGIPSVYGSQFRRVALPNANRAGLLGHGSILTVTSRPNRTSPVLRGKWILENILGTAPPPPPPSVPPFDETPEGSKSILPMRERMAQHRSNPTCAGCHSMIDPAGFALENFDAVGRWRDVDEAYQPIDTEGTMPDATSFKNLAEFRNAILRRPENFATTVTEKLLIYALGRGLEYNDAPAVRRIVREAAPGGFKLSSLVLGIIKSNPFMMRKTSIETSASIR